MGGVGQSPTPDSKSLVPKPGPINNAKHDRLSHPQENQPQRLEWIIDAADRFNPSSAERVPIGRRDIAAKRGEMERGHYLTHWQDYHSVSETAARINSAVTNY